MKGNDRYSIQITILMSPRESSRPYVTASPASNSRHMYQGARNAHLELQGRARLDISATEGPHGVGARRATAAQAEEQVPRAALHATIAAGTPRPAVTVPKVNPAPA